MAETQANKLRARTRDALGPKVRGGVGHPPCSLPRSCRAASLQRQRKGGIIQRTFEGGVEATDFHPPLWKSFLSLKVLFCFFFPPP